MNKKGSLKNYIILMISIALTVLLTFYVLNLYKQYNDTKLGIPVISSVLRQVNYNDLDNVIQERDFLVVYTCTSSEMKCRTFENKFKDYIIESNLSEDIVYFNIGYDKEENNVLETLYNKYKHNDLIKKIHNYPTILIFSEGKIIDLLSPSKDSKVSIAAVEEFLGGYDL